MLITDNKSLTFLINKRMGEIKPTIARKVIFLQQYDFDIIHKDGDKIKHAYALSRYIPNTNIEEISNQFLVLFKENMNVTVVF